VTLCEYAAGELYIVSKKDKSDNDSTRRGPLDYRCCSQQWVWYIDTFDPPMTPYMSRQRRHLFAVQVDANENAKYAADWRCRPQRCLRCGVSRCQTGIEWHRSCSAMSVEYDRTCRRYSKRALTSFTDNKGASAVGVGKIRVKVNESSYVRVTTKVTCVICNGLTCRRIDAFSDMCK